MKSSFFIVLAIFFINCKNIKKSEYKSVEPTLEREMADAGQSHPGKQLMESECHICHDPNTSQESMIAPPLITVKNYYIDETTSKQQFTEDLIKWVNDPETDSKIPAALLEFGSMPYIPYPDDAIVQIAEYIYDYDIERPKWYNAALEQGNGESIVLDRDVISKEIQNKNRDIGMAYAMSAKTALGKNLVEAIGKKGTAAAIEFCSTRASAITDSVSVMKNAVIKRVSDKPRNPKNMANDKEVDYITYYKKIMAAGKQPKAIVQRADGEVEFYYPITTNAMCLQCHGEPSEQIQPQTMAKLADLYPKDQAVAYDLDEVRGIWSISFEEK